MRTQLPECTVSGMFAIKREWLPVHNAMVWIKDGILTWSIKHDQHIRVISNVAVE